MPLEPFVALGNGTVRSLKDGVLLAFGQARGDDPPDPPDPPTSRVASIGTSVTAAFTPINNQRISTPSGFVISRKHGLSGGRIFFTHNDSGHASIHPDAELRIIAFSDQSPYEILWGALLSPGENFDTEELAWSNKGGTDYLWLFDIGAQGDSERTGDAIGRREIYRIEEPTVTPGQDRVSVTVAPVKYTFPLPVSSIAPTQTNMEAAIVDPRTGDVFLFQKRVGVAARPASASVWRCPAAQFTDAGGAVTFTEVAVIPTLVNSGINNGFCAASITEDGSAIFVKNYEELWIYNRANTQTVAEALNDNTPLHVHLAGSLGGEAADFDPGDEPARIYMQNEYNQTTGAATPVRYIGITWEDDDEGPAPQDPYTPTVLGRMPGGTLVTGDVFNEGSGGADSRLHDDTWYTHEDSHAGYFYAMGYAGSGGPNGSVPLRKAFKLTGQIQIGQWEDMSYDFYNGRRKMWIANCGGAKNSFPGYHFDEPTSLANPSTVTNVAAETYWFKYPGSATYDCETMMCDPLTGRVYFLTKEAVGTAQVYAAPGTLVARTSGGSQVNQLTQLTSGNFTKAGNLTGGDFSPNGNFLYVANNNTRGFKYSVQRDDATNVITGFTFIEEFPMPHPTTSNNTTVTAETLFVTKDGKSLIRSSEGGQPQVIKLALA